MVRAVDPDEILPPIEAPLIGEQLPGLHRQQEMKMPDGTLVQVDVGLVELLGSLWSQEVPTTYSCQGEETRPLPDGIRQTIPAYIVIPDLQAAARVATALRSDPVTAGMIEEGSVTEEVGADHSHFLRLDHREGTRVIFRWTPSRLPVVAQALSRLPEHHDLPREVWRRWEADWENDASTGVLVGSPFVDIAGRPYHLTDLELRRRYISGTATQAEKDRYRSVWPSWRLSVTRTMVVSRTAEAAGRMPRRRMNLGAGPGRSRNGIDEEPTDSETRATGIWFPGVYRP